MNANVEDILQQIDDLLDSAWAMPLSGGKGVVDVEQIRKLLDRLRGNIPAEVRQARAIVKDRADIISTAKQEAESIIRNAEERRNQILSHEEIVTQAQEKANEIQAQTHKRAREMRKSAQEFKAALDRHGLHVASMHVPINQIRDNAAQVLADAKLFGAQH